LSELTGEWLHAALGNDQASTARTVESMFQVQPIADGVPAEVVVPMRRLERSGLRRSWPRGQPAWRWPLAAGLLAAAWHPSRPAPYGRGQVAHRARVAAAPLDGKPIFLGAAGGW